MCVNLDANNCCTVEDLKKLPDNERWELIDGRLYLMASPSEEHQRISGFLQYIIMSFIMRNNGTCKVRSAPYSLFINDKNYLQPDILVVCDKEKIHEDGCHGAPDWVIEIVSKSSQFFDYSLKQLKYMEMGVKEYWVVDPFRNRTSVYNFSGEGAYAEYSFFEEINSNTLEGLSFVIKDSENW